MNQYLRDLWDKLLNEPGTMLFTDYGNLQLFLLLKGEKLFLSWGATLPDVPQVSAWTLSDLFEKAKLPFEIDEETIPLENWH